MQLKAVYAEDENDKGETGDCLADAFHDGLAGGGEENIGQLSGKTLETTLNDKCVKAQEDDLEEVNRFVAQDRRQHLLFHEKSDAEETETGDEEADEEHKSPADRSEKASDKETGDKVDPTHKHRPVIGVGVQRNRNVGKIWNVRTSSGGVHTGGFYSFLAAAEFAQDLDGEPLCVGEA